MQHYRNTVTILYLKIKPVFFPGIFGSEFEEVVEGRNCVLVWFFFSTWGSVILQHTNDTIDMLTTASFRKLEHTSCYELLTKRRKNLASFKTSVCILA